MRLPSVQQIFYEARRTFLRFPLVLANVSLGTLAAVILIDHEAAAEPTVFFKILLAAIPGFPLLTGFALFAEKQKWDLARTTGLQLTGVLILLGYGCSVPSDLANAPAIHILRMMIIAVALILFVTFAPFTAKGMRNGFWHYNKLLVLRLIITGVYSVVLFAGLALALAALDNLFGMNVPGKRYAQLWAIIIGLFATWSFLAGVPEEPEQLESASDYPVIVKMFTQYILLPLVVVYLVILYAYMVKILIAWDWPQGWVSRLILGFATTGIISMLLLYPLREQTEHIWIKRASLWLNILMMPLVIMLQLALWRRISEYGITEGRYIAVILGFWLGGIVLYFILSRTRSIKSIPVSLSVLALFISFGPWSAFNVSENSQVNRLEELLTKNKILVNGQVQKAPEKVLPDDVGQISSILSYLHDIHGYDRIQNWFKESLKEEPSPLRSKYKDPSVITGMLGIEYSNVRYRAAGDDIIFRSNPSGYMNIEGYDHMIRGTFFDSEQGIKSFTNQDIQFIVNSDSGIITFMVSPVNAGSDSLNIQLLPLCHRLLAEHGELSASNIPVDKMMAQAENRNLRVKIYFRSLRLKKEENQVELLKYQMDILYKTETK